MTASSRQTLLANLIQQVCAAVLLLTLPNLLDKAAYAQVVFVGVVLSFMALADLGLSQVYGRLVPALVAAGDAAAVQRWNASALAFGLITSMVFSLLAALMYWLKYGHAGYAVVLLCLPVSLYWASFHVTRMTVTGDFSEYRRAISIRAISSLLAIPLAFTFSLLGWFLSQVVAALLVLGYIGQRLLEPSGSVDWWLVRKHVPEGVLLCAITAAWLQLLNFGRLYASMLYPADAVAHYGVAGAAYQSLSTLLISAFLPVTVGVLGRFGRSDKEAFDYMSKVLAGSVWWILIGAFFVIEAAPNIFKFIFPAYRFDTWMLFALLAGVVFYPFLILFGNCLVGKKRGGVYLYLTIAGLLVCTIAATLIDAFFQGMGAAWGQLLGLMVYTFGLFLATRSSFGTAARETWRHMGGSLVGVSLLVLTYGGLRWGWV